MMPGRSTSYTPGPGPGPSPAAGWLAGAALGPSPGLRGGLTRGGGMFG